MIMLEKSNPECFDIGVIIPIFNSGQQALNAILSVVNQTSLQVREIVVVDDGSTDGSASFLRIACHDLRIPVRILSIPNGGAANARNFGMLNCNCDLYAFLDSDDTWRSDKIELQVPFFTNPSVGLVGSLTTMTGGSFLSSWISCSAKVVSVRRQLFKNYFQTSTVVVRRQVVEALGGFPINQRHAEEGDLFNRIAAHYKCILLPEVLVDYGCGKQGFGASGLSANLVSMEKGELRNIWRAYSRDDCGFVIFVIAVSYSIAKFARRVIVTSFRRLQVAI